MSGYKLCRFLINSSYPFFNGSHEVLVKRCTNYCINRWNTTNITSSTRKENTNKESVTSDDGEYFRHLLRESKFINIGDPQGKSVIGNVFHVVNDDLYIDFGWKFYCVCPRPLKNGERYVRGTKVYLRIKDLELSSRFLGSEKDLTLLEADATITGLQSSPIASTDKS